MVRLDLILAFIVFCARMFSCCYPSLSHAILLFAFAERNFCHQGRLVICSRFIGQYIPAGKGIRGLVVGKLHFPAEAENPL